MKQNCCKNNAGKEWDYFEKWLDKRKWGMDDLRLNQSLAKSGITQPASSVGLSRCEKREKAIIAELDKRRHREDIEDTVEHLMSEPQYCPESFYDWYLIGMALLQQGRSMRSLSYFEEALDLNPRAAYIHQVLAKAYRELPHCEKQTQEHYERAFVHNYESGVYSDKNALKALEAVYHASTGGDHARIMRTIQRGHQYLKLAESLPTEHLFAVQKASVDCKVAPFDDKPIGLIDKIIYLYQLLAGSHKRFNVEWQEFFVEGDIPELLEVYKNSFAVIALLKKKLSYLKAAELTCSKGDVRLLNEILLTREICKKELGFEAGASEEERRLLSEIKSTGTSQAAAQPSSGIGCR